MCSVYDIVHDTVKPKTEDTKRIGGGRSRCRGSNTPNRSIHWIFLAPRWRRQRKGERVALAWGSSRFKASVPPLSLMGRPPQASETRDEALGRSSWLRPWTNSPSGWDAVRLIRKWGHFRRLHETSARWVPGVLTASPGRILTVRPNNDEREEGDGWTVFAGMGTPLGIRGTSRSDAGGLERRQSSGRLSDEIDNRRRSIPGRWSQRRRHADCDRSNGQNASSVPYHREHRRRRRCAWERAGCLVAARWLYAACREYGFACRSA